MDRLLQQYCHSIIVINDTILNDRTWATFAVFTWMKQFWISIMTILSCWYSICSNPHNYETFKIQPSKKHHLPFIVVKCTQKKTVCLDAYLRRATRLGHISDVDRISNWKSNCDILLLLNVHFISMNSLDAQDRYSKYYLR